MGPLKQNPEIRYIHTANLRITRCQAMIVVEISVVVIIDKQMNKYKYKSRRVFSVLLRDQEKMVK